MFKQKCALLFVTILYYAPKQGSSLALFDVMHYVILSCNGGIQDNTLGWPAWPQELPLHLTASFNIARLLNPSTFVLCLSSELSFKLGKNSSFFPLSRPFNAYLSYWIGLKKKNMYFCDLVPLDKIQKVDKYLLHSQEHDFQKSTFSTYLCLRLEYITVEELLLIYILRRFYTNMWYIVFVAVGSTRYMWWLYGMTVGMEIDVDQRVECQQVGPSDHFQCLSRKLIWIPSIFGPLYWNSLI